MFHFRGEYGKWLNPLNELFPCISVTASGDMAVHFTEVSKYERALNEDCVSPEIDAWFTPSGKVRYEGYLPSRAKRHSVTWHEKVRRIHVTL